MKETESQHSWSRFRLTNLLERGKGLPLPVVMIGAVMSNRPRAGPLSFVTPERTPGG